MAKSLIDSVDWHLAEWDNQVDIGLNSSSNCSMFLEFVYLSRDRIRMQLDFLQGNFSAEAEVFQAQGEQGQSITWAMTYMSTAASLASAHLHIHGALGAARRECLSEPLQLLFLMSLKRFKTLLHNQLRQLWVIFQGTSEHFWQGSGRWLSELVELFEADLRTMESIMETWQPPPHELLAEAGEDAQAKLENFTAPRPGPPLPGYREREPDGSLSTLEVLRRDTFEEWNARKPLMRALLRHVFPRDGHVADFCAGSGLAASWINDTGLLTAYAFDGQPNINLLSRGAVEHAPIHAAPLSLWRSFDIVFCLSAAEDFGSNAAAWLQAWHNIDAHAARGVILVCGTGAARREALGAAEASAPELQYDPGLSEQLDSATGESREGVCVFWRQGSGS